MELSPTQDQAMVSPNHLAQRLRKRPLLYYFLITFGATWAYEALVFGILHVPISEFWATFLLLLVGPAMAAFVMTALTQGRAGVRQLLRRCVLWRVGFSWYLLVLLGVPALLLIPYLIQPGAFAAFRMPGLDFWLTYLIVYVLTLVAGGPLAEEPGWRGFALPRLQRRSGPLVGTLLLGALWGLWHLPLFLFVPGYNGAGSGFLGILIPFLAFVIVCGAYTVVYTWVFNNTQGSVLLAILLHTSLNTAPALLPELFPSLARTPLFGVSVLLLWVAVAALLITITRGRLSYQRYLRETARLAPVTDIAQQPNETCLTV
jgi:membrane protease YdiL (CAAX protease family)